MQPPKKSISFLISLTLLMLLPGLLMGCNRGQAQPAADAVTAIRQPKPTFTPVVNEANIAVAQPTPASTEGGDASAAGQGSQSASIAQPTGAMVIVSDPLVNLRSGPGLDYDIVAVAERGEEFDITGKSSDGTWWQICCTVDGSVVWIINELADTNGPVDSVPVAEGDAVAAAPAGGFSVGQVKATVNIPLLNARSEANTTSEVVALVEAGQQYDVLSTSLARDWWQVCCVDGREAWLNDEFVDLQGPAATVPIFGQTAPAAEAEAAPAALTFDLTDQEQFAETTGVRIFLFVSDAEDRALGDYSLTVSKNGNALAVEGASFGGQPGFTWPFQDARQRSQNFKAEFPGEDPAGVWEVQLVDGNGEPAGPAATFELAADDPMQELYVRYKRR
ncbi:MAG: SH3 domain-containing protein [Caldilineaceae bacterium]|nr:SH3 domain-containing protein [Caldilineaceae bacterium]